MRFHSILAGTLKNRLLSVLIIALPLLFMLLNLTSLLEWECLFFKYTGFKCGGCGMTRGIITGLKGEFKESFNFHPFAIPLLLVWVGYAVVYFLPKKSRDKVIEKIEITETKTGIAYVFVAIFAIFGLVRFIMELCREG